MDPSIKVTFQKDTRKGEECLNGQMENFMMASGKKEKKMEVGCGKDLMEIHTLENGKKAEFKDLEFLSPILEIGMKDSLKIP